MSAWRLTLVAEFGRVGSCADDGKVLGREEGLEGCFGTHDGRRRRVRSCDKAVLVLPAVVEIS